MTNKPQNTDAQETQGASLLPAFLKLRGRKVLLVGGGPVAVAKFAALREVGARVTVVDPAIDPALRVPGVVVHERPFAAADLDDVWYVVAAAPAEVNRQVAAAAEERRLFVNAVDDLAAASAYAGGVVRRGEVTIALSTGGSSPALAGLLREGLDAMLPADLETWVTTAQALRPGWRQDNVPIAARRPLLLQALNQLYGARGDDDAEVRS